MVKKVQNKFIPPEILETLGQDVGYSWLIKGLAGVGKTTFALSLLHYLENFEPIYLSTRVAPTSLFKQFPFLKNRLESSNILDATRTYIPPVKSKDPEGKRMKDHLMRTIRYSSVPEILKIIYDKVEEYKNPIIVIDSWDAILGMTKDTENSKDQMETLFTEFIRQTEAKLILIAESTDTTFLDYIVDGILTISDELVDGRTFRLLNINKIRAVERKQKIYPFTLYDNHFQSCLPFKEQEAGEIKKWEMVPDNAETFSTGSKEIDQLYGGGLRQGTFNLIEVESNVPINSYSSIIINSICNFIKNNRGVIVHTMDGINSDLLDKKRLFLYLETDTISKYMRIITEKITDRNEIRPYIIQADKKKFNSVFFDTYANLSSMTKFQPVFASVSYDNLQFMVDFESSIADLYKHIKLIRNSNVIEMGIINTYNKSQPSKQKLISLTEDLSYVSNTHVKIIEREGSIFIYGVKPRTYIYHMETNYDSGVPKIELKPIV